MLRDDRFLLHDPGPGHPERRERLAAIHADLDRSPIPGTRRVTPRAATAAELLAIHRPEHLARMEATAGRPATRLDADTATGARSHDAALLAAGGAVQAAEAVVSGAARGAFVLCRPPGHHAEADAAMGFCLFNNAAIAAEHARAQLGCRRVLVLDPDIHHGNGTQNAFWRRPDVLYVSSHRFPFYPGTGAATEVGAGPGAGFTLNLPLPPRLGDADLLHLYLALVGPVVRRFEPELIVVSAGFDTWHRDPLGDLSITAAGFRALFALFRSWAEAHCPGRLVAVLEGGYDPAGVAAGVRAALEVLAAGRAPDVEIDGPVSPAAQRVEAEVRAALAPHWAELRA